MSEQLFRLPAGETHDNLKCRFELKRLQRMTQLHQQQESKIDKDFFGRFWISEERRDHTHQIEHYGTDFWSHYYRGEAPAFVFKNKSVPRYQFGKFDREASIEEHMLSLRFIPGSETMKTRALASQQCWMDHIILAQEAINCGDLREAEDNFRIALKEAEKWGPLDIRLKQTLLSLANSLSDQGKYAESADLYARAAAISKSSIREHIS